MSFMDILRQYAEPNAASAATSPAHFDEVVKTAPPQAIGSGVAEAFRSDQTPPFGDMVAQLFGQSNTQQRAGVLNQLLGAIPPGMLSGLAGGVLGRMVSAASSPERMPVRASSSTISRRRWFGSAASAAMNFAAVGSSRNLGSGSSRSGKSPA